MRVGEEWVSGRERERGPEWWLVVVRGPGAWKMIRVWLQVMAGG